MELRNLERQAKILKEENKKAALLLTEQKLTQISLNKKEKADSRQEFITKGDKKDDKKTTLHLSRPIRARRTRRTSRTRLQVKWRRRRPNRNPPKQNRLRYVCLLHTLVY